MRDLISGKIRAGLPALYHRNFRLFWFGQCISLIGTWMQSIGQAWLVLQLTHSALKLSIVTAMQFLPVMIFSLYAGTLVDRFSKRKTLIFTQTCLGVLATVLATITYLHIVKYWHVLILALILGSVNTIDTPTRQSFVIELVGKEDLPNAIALNSSVFNLGRIVGPAIAGLLIGLIGIAPCFYLNAASFIAVIVNLWMIRVPAKVFRKQEHTSPKYIWLDIREGLRYINEKAIIKQPLILLAFISTFVMNFNILIPVFAQQELNQNATGYGLLMTSMGIGSFLGSLALVVKSRRVPAQRYLVGGAFVMSAFLVILAFEKNIHLSSVTLLIIGFSTIIHTNLVNTTIQLHSSDEMRGRVMSVFSLVFGGVTPIGALYAGQTTELIGARGCMIISGVIGILAAGYFVFAMRRRREAAGR